MKNTLKTTIYILSFLVHKTVNFFKKSAAHVTVLMYHSIGNSGWKLAVTPEKFERQIIYLRKHYIIVSLSDIVAHARGTKKLEQDSVAITIDDGYLDTYTTVFPILKKYNISATVFLTTDLSVKEKLNNLPRPTWVQIKEMIKSGLVNFEVHGQSHQKFSDLLEKGKGFLKNDIEKCHSLIKENTGYNPCFLSYPFGDRNREVTKVVKDLGFEAAFSINKGTIKPDSNLFSLKRTQVDNTTSFLQFQIRLTGALDTHRTIVDLFRSFYGNK